MLIAMQLANRQTRGGSQAPESYRISVQSPYDEPAWALHAHQGGRVPAEAVSEQESHHRPGREGTAYFGEARRGEHGLGPGVEGRPGDPGGLKSGHVDRMALDGRRALLAGELDGAVQESQSDTGSPGPAVDGETRDPPNPAVIVGQHSGESSVSHHPGKGERSPTRVQPTG
jgi:hypothetical protein